MNDIARYSAFPLHRPTAGRQPQQQQQRAKGIWSIAEHDRFLDALKQFPLGPWKAITDHIGSRSIRQVQTHAQKYQEKVLRRLNGSSKAKVLRLRQEHRIDHDVLEAQSLLTTPGERRRVSRKASAAKLTKSGSTTSLSSQPSLERSSTGEREDDDDDDDEEEDAPAFGSDLFRLSLSELDDESGDAKKLRADGDRRVRDDDEDEEEDEEEGDLPSLSECLDFFIKCFSATSQPLPTASSNSSRHES